MVKCLKKIIALSVILLLVACTSNKDNKESINNDGKLTGKELILDKYNLEEVDTVLPSGSELIAKLNYLDTIDGYDIYNLYTLGFDYDYVSVDICYFKYHYHRGARGYGVSDIGLYLTKEYDAYTFEEAVKKDLITDKDGLFNLLKDRYGWKFSDGTYKECEYIDGSWKYDAINTY